MVNPTIYVSCIKWFWATIFIKKANDVVKLRALIDGKRVVVTEDVIRQILHLDDANDVDAKRTAWNEFSCSMASDVICLATGRKFNFSKYIFDSMVRNVDSPNKFLMYLRFLQVIINAQVADLSSHNNQYTSPALTQKLEQDKFSQALEIFKLKKRVKKLEKKKRSKSFGLKRKMHPNKGKIKSIDADVDITLVDAKTQEYMDAELQGRIDDAAATKEVNAAESTVYDDEEMAKRLHDEEVEQAKAREKQEKDDLEKAKGLQQQYDEK
nr:hypothetical protein [Tanacetum cinerariifolium]